ncbi:MAG: hypothetical protein JJD93_12715 [Ilumatobacteraceae bacterium]|nr:hypothetical protein [Ilumatobacteraceae bacterium]
MRYVKITNDDRGGSRFEDVEVPQATVPYTENVAPLLVSAEVAATGVIFVTTPPDVREAKPHAPPRRQFVVVLEGEVEVETSNGEKRTFTPGMVALAEDVGGEGHITRVVSSTPWTFMAIPIAD